METISQKCVTTRKSHQCVLCLREFPKNTRMEVQAILSDGTVGSIYICQTCYWLRPLARDKLIDFYDHNSYPEGCVHDALPDGMTPEEWLASLRK